MQIQRVAQWCSVSTIQNKQKVLDSDLPATGAFLCRAFMFSLYLFGFPPGTPVFFHRL